jgi:deoxyribodipyrimidine photo-lyase
MTSLRLETPAFFPPTRATGLARLEAFLPQAGRAYAEGRNHDHGPDRRHNTGAISPFLSHRLLTEGEVVAAALGRHGEKGAEKFVAEVYWRTYFKGWLESRPSVWQRYRQAVQQQADGLRGGLAKAYDEATEGRTGIDAFDAWTEELTSVGYLHNHARMWYASLWIFTLRLPWVLGADFFHRHLLDGDAASNTLSWRWVAGLHTQGKAYVAARENIRRYTDGRFDPSGLAPHAQPLEDDWNGAPAPTPSGDAIGTGPALLLLHEDDLHPESIEPLRGTEIAGVATLPFTAGRSPLPVAELVLAFAEGALADGLSRAVEAFGAEGRVLSGASELAAFAREVGAAQVVTPYAPVGEVADGLRAVGQALEAEGLPLRRAQRSYDAEAWPYCTKGFFALKKRVPELVRSYAA